MAAVLIAGLASLSTLTWAATSTNGSNVPFATADWVALSRAYADARRAYAAARGGQRQQAGRQATTLLEKAGVLRAIDAPVLGLGPPLAAQLLNDYGFWAARADGASGDAAVRAIRRALVLDPSRNIAHLNLADLLSSQLARTVHGDQDVDAQREEIRREYRRYLAGGGKPTAVASEWARPVPAVPPHASLCAVIDAYVRADHLHELLSTNGRRIPFGDRRVDLTLHFEGTGIFPQYAMRDADDGREFDDPLQGAGDHGDAAIVSYGGQFQVIALSGMADHSSTLDGKRGCDIERIVTERIAAADQALPVCQLAHAGKLKPVEFAARDVAAVPHETLLAPRWPSGRVEGSAVVDVYNNGHPLHLVQLSVFQRQPSGCDASVFDVLREEGTSLANGPAHALLMSLQGVATSEYSADCYSRPHWIRHAGRTYLETLTMSGANDGGQVVDHSLAYVERGAPQVACHFEFDQTVRVVERAGALN